MKVFLVGLLSLLMSFMFVPAHGEEDPDENPVDPRVVGGKTAFIMWHGQDWGKITADRLYAIPRDGECDGNAVYITLMEDDYPLNYKKVYDNNGCDTGGGKFSVPAWANRAMLCEESVGCTPKTPLSEW